MIQSSALALQAIDVVLDIRRQRLQAVLPCRRQRRTPLRSLQKGGLTARWNDAIEDEDEQYGQKANAKGSEQGADDTIRNADRGADHFTHRQPQQCADRGARGDKHRKEDQPDLRCRHFQICREQWRQSRRRRHRDAHPAQIAKNRRKAAQKARHESKDHGDEKADVDGEIERVGREEVHCGLSGPDYALRV